MWPALLLALTAGTAHAQQVGLFVGPKVLFRTGPRVHVGFGLAARAAVHQSRYPEPVGPELGLITEARVWGAGEVELLGGGSAGVGVGTACFYLPNPVIDLAALAGYDTRYGAVFQARVEVRAAIFEVGAEVARLRPRRADLAPAWGSSALSAGAVMPLLFAACY